MNLTKVVTLWTQMTLHGLNQTFHRVLDQGMLLSQLRDIKIGLSYNNSNNNNNNSSSNRINSFIIMNSRSLLLITKLKEITMMMMIFDKHKLNLMMKLIIKLRYKILNTKL